jgi:hypothetical protein
LASDATGLLRERQDFARRRTARAGSGDYLAWLNWTKDQSQIIITELSKIEGPSSDIDNPHPRRPERRTWDDAIALLLCLSWWTLGEDEASRTMPMALEDTYAGRILEEMIHHWRRRKEEKAKHHRLNSPGAIALRRAERLASKQAKHERRIAEKALRDRSLILLGEARYGKGHSRRQLFERLVSDNLTRQY